MIELFERVVSIVVATLSSVGVVALLAYVFKEYIRRSVDYVFRAREERLRYQNSVSLELLKAGVPIVQEIVELVYRTRNHAKTILEQSTPVSVSVEHHRETTAVLTERLYRFRALIDGDVWDKLHEFKRANQDFCIILDVAGRDEVLCENKIRFGDQTLVRLREIYGEIDRLYVELTHALQQKLREGL